MTVKMDQIQNSSINNYSPLSKFSFNVELDSRVKEVVLGVFSGAGLFVAMNYIERAIVFVLEKLHVDLSSNQEVIDIWDNLDALPSGFNRTVSKCALFGYIVFLGPLIEEFIFRKCLYSITKENVAPSNSLQDRTIRIASNAILFGAAHYAPSQGGTNIVIIAATTLIGLALASLHEYTGNITASTATHMSYNGLVMAHYLLI